MYFDENEPVFKRSKWGTTRYAYNPRNPVGFALIVVTLVVVGVVMLLMVFRAGPFAVHERPAPTPTPLSTPAGEWDADY
ncbi:hypothetical protein [Streptomyces tagetis]|uniref:Uncharacterized protein n=1 Tax=Streptomyces tagetis TaxID=2820809 RepID=A0A940XWK2_9ACTN|nr:hypothetical protein [Streptomyces sp. RG38]MBQ0830858.1 hypothetical protein [Streptomyces sp. RG38]